MTKPVVPTGSHHNRIASLEFSVLAVTPVTHWAFLKLVNEEGEIGWGEATLTGHETQLQVVIQAIAKSLLGLTPSELMALCRRAVDGVLRLPEAAVYSALNLAAWDLAARTRSMTLADALGGRRRDKVELYANINRRTSDRSPAGFAQSVRDAKSAGFSAIKIAPFDEVERMVPWTSELDASLQLGLDRIIAAREAAGSDVRLMVDCHWRLNRDAALRVIEVAGAIGLHWLECPIPEHQENLPTLRRLRSAANDRGILLAGCEEAVSWEGMQSFVDVGAYDVYMPDIKYIGGIDAMLHVCEQLEKFELRASPHNPSGPVAHAASLQVCAVINTPAMLEIQFDETPFFERLVAGSLGLPADGYSALPSGTGTGVNLLEEQVDRCLVQRFRVNARHSPATAM